LVRHVAPGNSGKSVALRDIVKKEFAKNRNVQDEQQIEALQSHAVRALSNYLLFQSSGSDPKVKQAFKTFHDKHVKDAGAGTGTGTGTTISAGAQPAASLEQQQSTTLANKKPNS
jgi:hypothetical protein